MTNIRHEIDQDDVRASIEESNARHFRDCQSRANDYAKMYLKLNWAIGLNMHGEPFLIPEENAAKELQYHIVFNSMNLKYYSTVRVIERMNGGDKPFILVYGDVDDDTINHGTGGFETYEAAKSWFMGGGR